MLVTLHSGAQGLLSGTTSLAASGGIVSFTDLGLTGRTGTDYVLRFTAGAMTLDTAALRLSPGTASALVFGTQPSGSNTAGAAFATQPVINIVDAQGNVVTSATDDITLALSSGSGTLSGTGTLAAVSGVAAFSDLSIETAGSGKVLTASASGLTAVESSSFAVVPAAPSRLAFVTQPGLGHYAGALLSPQPVIEVQDAFGNRCTTDQTTEVSVEISDGDGAPCLARGR
ncbi:hypothetical protein ACFSHQ_07110 [Gemmobacter lanyuensis]